MFLKLIGVGETIINLETISLIDDESDEIESKVRLTTNTGNEIELAGPEADALLSRLEILLQETDVAIARLRQIGVQQQ